VNSSVYDRVRRKGIMYSRLLLTCFDSRSNAAGRYCTRGQDFFDHVLLLDFPLYQTQPYIHLDRFEFDSLDAPPATIASQFVGNSAKVVPL
jgi:hypothetical protein